MMCLIVRRREKGRAIPAKQLEKVVPLREDVHIGSSHSEILGRMSVEASIFKHGPYPDIIPPLLDARVVIMAQNGMTISGIEWVDDALYAQSWWCRFE